MPYEIALVERLISGLKELLPCYSGKSIEQLSTDKGLHEIINVLIQLHEMRLSTLLRRLFGLLESMSRGNSGDDRKNNLLQQSQLIVLRIIATGMFYHWHQIYAAHGVNSDKALTALNDSRDTEEGAADSHHSVGSGYNKSAYPLFYPNPLDEPIAKYAFQMAARYFRSWPNVKLVRIFSDTIITQARYMFFVRRNHLSQSQPLIVHANDIAIGTSMLQKLVKVCLHIPISDIGIEIQEAAGAIFMFISATNWNLAMQRAKSCLYLAASRGDEVADLTDIRFLEFASMDLTRLVQVIDAFAEAFPRLKHADQVNLAITLRRVISAFTNRCAGTFIDMYQKVYRPSTVRIEQLSDALSALIESDQRATAHTAFFQLKAALFTLCPEAVAHAADHMDGRGDGRSKQTAFINTIKQQLRSREVPEGFIHAALELQRAATILTVIPGNNIARIVQALEADINRVILDSSRLLLPYREEPVDPKQMLTHTLISQLQIDPEKALRYFLSLLTGPKSDPSLQMVFIYCVNRSLGQKHFANSVHDVPFFNKVVSQTFIDLLRRSIATVQSLSEQQSGAGAQRGRTGHGSRRQPNYASEAQSSGSSMSIIDMAYNMPSSNDAINVVPQNEISQRVLVISIILTTLIEEPKLAVWGENEVEKFESLESIVGAISSCIQEPSVAVQRLAGLALRTIFSPRSLAEWMQSEDIAFAVWTLSLQVIQGICRAIVHSMVTSTSTQHRQLLVIMHDMLVLSNNILETSSGALTAAIDMPENAQF
ncbi:Ras GTPase activating protein ira2, partial [Dipsacomyces acuminosporus]